MIRKIYYWLHRLTSFSEEQGEYSSGYWQDLARKETLKLCKNLKGKVLEVGCGEGLFLAKLAKQNRDLEIWGIDNNKNLLEKAKRRLQENNLSGIQLFLEEATRLSFKDEYFEAVICINVIFNLKDKETVKKVLEEIARVCKKKGRIIIEFRNQENPLLLLKYKLAPLYDATVKDLPLKTYRLKEISSILEELGLAITNKLYLGFMLKKFAPIIILEVEKI